MTNPPSTTALRILHLPGWQGSSLGHWQSEWAHHHGEPCVEQDDWDWPKRGDWMSRLEEVLLADPTPAVLVAHSLGCHLVAAWAAHSQNTDRVLGALLVAPPDLEREGAPPQLAGWCPLVRARLPFESLVVYSDDDAYSAPECAVQIANDWGSEGVSVGPRGHINAESGLGAWPEGRVMLDDLIARVGSGPVSRP